MFQFEKQLNHNIDEWLGLSIDLIHQELTFQCFKSMIPYTPLAIIRI